MSTTSETHQVILPELGESVTEGTIVEWRVSPGDTVAAGDILLDLTTDKVDVEVPAPIGGVITQLMAQAGDMVEVGAVLALIGGDGTAVVAAPPATPTPDAAAPAAAPVAQTPPAPSAVAGANELFAVVLPEMESVVEGTVIEWYKKPGDAVAQNEDLLEISTDKVDTPVPSPVAGVLHSIAFQEGDTFSITDPICFIAVGDTPVLSATPTSAPSTQAPANGASAAQASSDAPATPVARRLAAQQGVNLDGITGSGPAGIITKADVANGATAPAKTQAPAVDGEVLLKGPSAVLAQYMDDSLGVPTATSFRTLSVATLDAQRRQINADLAAAGRTDKLSFTHLIAWAIITAGETFPGMNTGFTRREGKPYALPRDGVNLGLAVDVERKDGSRTLMVPVIKGANTLGFDGFRLAYDDLVARTRTGGISADELRGASITLTNPGGIGTIASVPRLMAGQGTIVATGSIAYPPGLQKVPGDRLRDLGVEKVMTMTSTYDHRVIQGAESGAFLAKVDQLLSGDDDFYASVRSSLGLGAAAPEVVATPAPAATPAAPLAASGANELELMTWVGVAMSVVKATRSHGHLAATLDPLGSRPPGDPALNPATIGLTQEMMAKIPASILRMYVPGETFLAALPNLQAAYSGNIAYEIEHISSHEQRLWWRKHIEQGDISQPLPPEHKRAVLERLADVDAFERFLRRQYLGQKTFSIEGVDSMVPLTDEIIELLGDVGTEEVVLGMAHRGRLAFITHVVGRPIESILGEFEGHIEVHLDDDEDTNFEFTAGDVKYHLGAEGTYATRNGREVAVTLAANPSHLEQVNAVAEGSTRARQTTRGAKVHQDPNVAVPIVIHGDAAFSGQGVVAETLNLQALRGYTTGGTIHIIANNQIGFTTDPQDSRSTHSASDLARGFDIPIIHVNADDVEAVITAARLAVAFRTTYNRDVLIDLIGYRRLGHNEVDEPAYTQPVMSRTIKAHEPVSKIYGQKLIDQGLLKVAEFDAIITASEQRMIDAHAAVVGQTPASPEEPPRAPAPEVIVTAVAEDVLRELNEQLITVPDSFTIHPKLKPQLDRRRQVMGPEGGIAWAHAEALAFASLLTVDGIPIRFTGQDVCRGTFSQRHLELHDVGDGETWTPHTGRTFIPMSNLPEAKASFEVHNSPLSEASTLGFEYGYSTRASESLVLWEAQYGDFANGAQMMIDQFIVSGRAKWGETSRLTLLLPHGYEGNGPEHSSGRIERFLQLAAEDNIRVANCSTAAQYFHLLRKQALREKQRPLVIFTPKSLLRLKAATSTLDDLVNGTFSQVLDDPTVTAPSKITSLILCSGKIYHELQGHAARAARKDLAIGRVEMLYPFPDDELRELFVKYPKLRRIIWVQEEPANMGAWDYIRPNIRDLVLPDRVVLDYEGRDRRASTSEGYPQAHQAEQERILEAALGPR